MAEMDGVLGDGMFPSPLARGLGSRVRREAPATWRFGTFQGLRKRLFMAALCNRAGHYIFALWFLSIFLLLFLVFTRLISAAVDWMSTILPHMVWP